MRKNILLLMALFVMPLSLYAGGYRVALQGVRQAALGAQGSALAHDASAAFFNPAALAFVEGKFSAAIGGFGAALASKYQNRNTGETAETDSPLGTPVYAAFSYKPIEDLAVGISVTTPFGSSVVWGNDWAGKYTISEIALQAIFYQPTVAYKFTDWLSVGAGVTLVKGSVNLQRNVAVGETDALMEIDAKSEWATGYNIGAYLKPTDKLSLGLAYRSKVEMEVIDGDAMWSNVPNLVSTSLPFTTDKFSAVLPMPYEFTFGATYQVTPKWLVAAELGSLGWEEYEELTLNFSNSEGDAFSGSSTRDYQHTYNFSFGTEYKASSNLTLRLGYKFDQTPSPDEYFSSETPTVDYHAFTGGLGYKMGKFNLDFMGEYLRGIERNFNNVEDNFAGDLNTSGFIFGLGVSCNL